MKHNHQFCLSGKRNRLHRVESGSNVSKNAGGPGSVPRVEWSRKEPGSLKVYENGTESTFSVYVPNSLPNPYSDFMEKYVT